MRKKRDEEGREEFIPETEEGLTFNKRTKINKMKKNVMVNLFLQKPTREE